MLLERSGVAPMAGRILGWLLVTDPPEQSAEALAEALDASRGSISMSTRLLIDLGVVERIRMRGERRAFYRFRPGVWSELLQRSLRRHADMRRLAERGLEVLGPTAGEQRESLEEMRDLYAFVECALPELIERWERERGDRERKGKEAGAARERANPRTGRRQ